MSASAPSAEFAFPGAMMSGSVASRSVSVTSLQAPSIGISATAEIPAARLVDNSYVDEAAKKLGPFVLEKQESKLPGCR